MAFNDATCPRCGKKVSWQGEMKDRPPCPGCGHTISQKDIDEMEAEMEAARKKLFGNDDDF